jgi:hypothetical protein
MPILIAAAAFALIGIYMLILGRRSVQVGTASLTWPKAPGRILKSEIKRGAKGSARADITYCYSVAGQSHTGSRVSFSLAGSNLNESSRIVKAHPAGSDVTVSYNPADPTEAVLEPGAKSGSTTTFLAALMFVGSLAMVGIYLYALSQGGVR